MNEFPSLGRNADVVAEPQRPNVEHVYRYRAAPSTLEPLDAADPEPRVGYWHVPVAVTENNFVHKSLSNWSLNPAVGCSHGCRFCYVPSASTIKQGPRLKQHGVDDPDAEWGEYVQLRHWDEKKFRAAVQAAERTPRSLLKPDGNRAVMLSSTTDAYQVVKHPDAARQRELNDHARFVVRRSLELIRDESTLNVRVLTRSPLARVDFDIFASFGDRLIFGMSLPTLRNDLARVYEPNAPAPSQRLATLRAAKAAGLHVYVAVAPTYAECGETDLRATLRAVAELDPVTVFHEPINIRAENVSRIAAHARDVGATLRTDVFESRENWRRYAIDSLQTAERVAREVGIESRLHLWPDKALGTAAVAATMPDPDAYLAWIRRWWSRVSEWPGRDPLVGALNQAADRARLRVDLGVKTAEVVSTGRAQSLTGASS